MNKGYTFFIGFERLYYASAAVIVSAERDHYVFIAVMKIEQKWKLADVVALIWFQPGVAIQMQYNYFLKFIKLLWIST